MSNPFIIKNNMLMGARGPIVADELDIPSPHTRRYQALEADIHTMAPQAAEDFGARLHNDINNFNHTDTLSQARTEGRLAYRSWPQGANATNPIAEPQARNYTSGYSSLSTSRNPAAIRNQQARFAQGLQPDPFTSAPSTMLGKDPQHAETLWSGSGPGMVSALLPEENYVAMAALSRRVQFGQTTPNLTEINHRINASVTRPDLFENKDLSSGVMTLGTRTERYGKPSMGSGNPASDFKLRENATRYQSYMQHVGPNAQDIHNEMAIHYRATGNPSAATEVKTHMVQPMKTQTTGGFLGMFGTTTQVPNGPPVARTLPEDPTRNTGALNTVLQRPNTTYQVLKK